MNNTFDVAVIGLGVAGVFSVYRMAKEHKNLKVLGIDLGRKWAKRRRQIDGWLGCLPNSDGKLYLNDLNKVNDVTNARKTKSAYTFVKKTLSGIEDLEFKTTKDKSLSVSLDKKIKKFDYDYYENDYIQIYPKDIHALSKEVSDFIENNPNMTFSFDNEVSKIYKQKNIFTIVTEREEFKCKKLIISVGRSGWRWANELYKNFDIIEDNNTAKFGIRVEMNSNYLKDFNKSNCTIFKNDIEIGPLSWHGTIIPEDHVDTAISAFRSNENRWKTDKVSFSLIGNRIFPNNGFEETDRLAKLTFVLTNDRILKEKISLIMSGKSKISILPEYNWLKDAIQDLSNIMPDIITKGYFHIPTIVPMPSKINIENDLSTEIDGMYVAGESAGVHGILSAACMGVICADSVSK